MTRVAVFGAGGRMGSTTCGAVAGAADLELVAAIDPGAAGKELGTITSIPPAGSAPSTICLPSPGDLVVVATPDEVDPHRVDVAVDFTLRDAALTNLRWCADHGVHAVCGTTGFSAEDRAALAAWFAPGRPANAVVAPNFSIGAALMMRCAELCAPHFTAVEVIELHHDQKRDAPSGTALAVVGRIEEARGRAGAASLPADRTEVTALPGARGARSAGGVPVHSVRMPGLLAHHELMFGSPGETLTVRHDSTDRVSFMPGVLLAVRKVAERDGLTIGLESLLGL